MFKRSWALAALLVLLACGTAAGAPITVQLRVEGSAATIFEGPVTTDGHVVDGGDGTGPHPCDGTNGGQSPVPRPTMTAALDDAHLAGGWHGVWDADFQDFLLDTIAGEVANSADNYWGTAVSFQPAGLGGCQQAFAPSDELLFAAGNIYGVPLLRLSGPGKVAVGTQVQVAVDDGKTGTPVEGADVGSAATGADGTATVPVGGPGLVSLKATKAGTIRSNALRICVSESGTGDCGVPPSQLGGASKPVRDSVAPRARISGPRDGRTYRRSPRLLQGVASDAESGVTEVKLAFRRHSHGRCTWWSGRREKFVGSNCHKKFFFAIGKDARWSYLLPRPLPAGRYVLDVKAFDRARNRDERFERGRNRVVFYVGSSKARARSAAKRGASVEAMVVGAKQMLAEPAIVRARPALVRVGTRRCKVARSTPLAVLHALLRKAHVAYRLRDYGNCSRRTSSGSGQLYVRRIASDRGRGNDGWFYKVNDKAPEIGAADPAAATLKRGDRVLWFYCRFEEASKSCQRSLRLVPGSGGGVAAQPFRIVVRGYDDRGRSVPVGGATVSTGTASVLTAADGDTGLVLPRGRTTLVATKEGAVPSFPLTIDVN